jgi:hypothetical protein
VAASLLAVLLCAALMATPSTAAFTEIVQRPSSPVTFFYAGTPFLWAIKGDTASVGRGPMDPHSSSAGSSLNSDDNMLTLGGEHGNTKPKVAETVLLDWDGSNTTLQFFVNLRHSPSSECPSVVPKVTFSWSPDRIARQPLWNSSGKWVDTNQWVGVRLTLPLSAATPRFAVKWVNTDPGSLDQLSLFGSNPCTVAYIDDITFPAQPPTAVNMGLGKPPGRLPKDSQECSYCLNLCHFLISQQPFNKAVDDFLGRPGLLP